MSDTQSKTTKHTTNKMKHLKTKRKTAEMDLPDGLNTAVT